MTDFDTPISIKLNHIEKMTDRIWANSDQEDLFLSLIKSQTELIRLLVEKIEALERHNNLTTF